MKINRRLTIIGVGAWFLSSTYGENIFTPVDETNSAKQASVSSQMSDQDSAILLAFEATKSRRAFLKDMTLDNEEQFTWHKESTGVLRGDLNGDGTSDALVRFSIEGRGGGNNFDIHYAIFLNVNHQWKYQGQIGGRGDRADRILKIYSIRAGVIVGKWEAKRDPSLKDIEVEYLLRDGQVINSFAELHRSSTSEREYLSMREVLTKDNTPIPMLGTLKGYEKLLGKGNIFAPDEQPECGTYFEEEATRYLDYPNLRFELDKNGNAILISMHLKDNLKLQTDKGTIDEATTLEKLKSIFYRSDSWSIDEEENGNKVFSIPDAATSDNKMHFIFDKTGKLIMILLFIPC